MAKQQTIGEIRAELVDEILQITYNDTPGEAGILLRNFSDKMVERSLVKFDKLIEDKQRQLELGELADKFFQRIKLND